MPRPTIAVTGVGVVTPFGEGRAKLLAGLLAGRSAITTLSLFPTTLPRPPVVGQVCAPLDVEVPADAWWSRTDRLAVIAAREAWTASRLPSSCRAGCDAIVATTVGGLSDIEPEAAIDPAAYYRRRGLAPASAYPVSRPADAVAAALDIGGASLGLSVACASGAVGIAEAARRIATGEISFALAGGADALCPFTLAGFYSLQALDPAPCRPFDRSRQGLNLGEGAGMLVLENMDHARRREAEILAVLTGWAFTNDAFHPTAPDEQGRGLAASVKRALDMSGRDPGEVGYVNAHGTGTPLNDVAEARGYEGAFAPRSAPVPVSSTKSYTGHTLGAAGAIEAVITILALQSQRLFPTLRLADPIPSPSVDWLTEGGRQAEMTVAMSVSAGFGGSNASLVFETPAGAR